MSVTPWSYASKTFTVTGGPPSFKQNKAKVFLWIFQCMAQRCSITKYVIMFIHDLQKGIHSMHKYMLWNLKYIWRFSGAYPDCSSVSGGFSGRCQFGRGSIPTGRAGEGLGYLTNLKPGLQADKFDIWANTYKDWHSGLTWIMCYFPECFNVLSMFTLFLCINQYMHLYIVNLPIWNNWIWPVREWTSWIWPARRYPRNGKHASLSSALLNSEKLVFLEEL